MTNIVVHFNQHRTCIHVKDEVHLCLLTLVSVLCWYKTGNIPTTQYCRCFADTRQAIYLQRNIEARSRHYCCRGQAICSTYLCVCVCARARARSLVKACVYVNASASGHARLSVDGCGCTEASIYLRAYNLTCPVFHAQTPYSLRPPWLHHMFRHYLINRTIFGKKKLLGIKCVFWFYLKHLFETFLILRKISEILS